LNNILGIYFFNELKFMIMTIPGNNLVENIVDAQKKVLDTVIENTKKISGENNVLNETIEKGSEWYKNWLETQKNIFTKATEKATGTAETVKETAEKAKETAKEAASKIKEFNENWFSTQMNLAKQVWEASQEWTKNAAKGNVTNPFAEATTNPFSFWQNNMNTASNPWGNWMNHMQPNNWMNQMPNMNPFANDSMKKATDTWTGIFNQYSNMLKNNFGDWQKQFENGTVHDAYKNMTNVGEGFGKFAEMWAPMMKSIQDKTFNTDVYKQFMNPDVYKEMLDKYFGFVPGGTEYIKQMNSMMTDGMKQMTDAGMNGYHQMNNFMNNPAFKNNQMFGNTLNSYNQWHGMMNEAVAPFSKMITPNQYTKSMNEWSDISNRIMVYNIKNAELQYMVYNQGQKVMDALAENTAKKVQEGKEVTSIIALYQEWLNISDKVYVSLFESEDYTKLMTEVNSLQMKLQKDIDLQMEKSLKGIPVATRSELDELYKTIYDLKRQVKDLERATKVAPVKETPAPAVVAEEKPAKSAKKA